MLTGRVTPVVVVVVVVVAMIGLEEARKGILFGVRTRNVAERVFCEGAEGKGGGKTLL